MLADVIPGDELMVEDIYGFLARGFYINFGVLPDPAPFGTADIWPGDAIRVLVVGAGVAGLAVTRALHQGGLQAVAFEARDRVGGRVHGVPMTSPRYVSNVRAPPRLAPLRGSCLRPLGGARTHAAI